MEAIAKTGGHNRLAGRSTTTSSPYRRGLAMVGALLAGLLTLSAGSAVGAPASAAAAAQTRGLVTLSTQVGTVQVTYSSCDPPLQRTLSGGRVTSFSNQPVPGCQAVLINDQGERFRLCAGSGRVPSAFQQSRRLLIQKGDTPRCSTQPIPVKNGG
jgi:hypothetical protein